ncbi:MAG: ArsR/SmtB family transcription factor [Candidatus Hodarchaeales archaeon]|jgi:ArsR family transcriptional regulator
MLAKNYQNALSAFFKALGNETRITVLQLLQKNNELNVMEMCKQLEMQQYHISRHLACLRNCGLVTTRREGKLMYYSLNEHERITQILNLADEHVQIALENILSCKIIQDR